MPKSALFEVVPGAGRFMSFPENLSGRDFVVGDIHGCFDKLEQLLWAIKFDRRKDRLFSVGDLVNKGRYSTDVLLWLNEPWFFPVMGNHEQIICSANYDDHNDPGSDLALSKGGGWFFGADRSHALHIQARFRELPVAIEVAGKNGARYGIVHGEPAGRDWELLVKSITEPDESCIRFSWVVEKCTMIEEIMWGRKAFKDRNKRFVKNITNVFVGHNRTYELLTLGNVHYIDSGSYHEFGRLTVMNMESGELFRSR